MHRAHPNDEHAVALMVSLAVAQQMVCHSVRYMCLCCPAGHEMEIVCLNFNPQSTLLATGSMDHTAKVLPCVAPAPCSSPHVHLSFTALHTCSCCQACSRVQQPRQLIFCLSAQGGHARQPRKQ